MVYSIMFSCSGSNGCCCTKQCTENRQARQAHSHLDRDRKPLSPYAQAAILQVHHLTLQQPLLDREWIRCRAQSVESAPIYVACLITCGAEAVARKARA